MLIYRKLAAGEIIVGDVFVSEDWHDSKLWGQTVESVEFITDDLTPRCGRLVSLRLTGSCGLLTRETLVSEVLRKPLCLQCGVDHADHPVGNGLDECPGEFPTDDRFAS